MGVAPWFQFAWFWFCLGQVGISDFKFKSTKVIIPKRTFGSAPGSIYNAPAGTDRGSINNALVWFAIKHRSNQNIVLKIAIGIARGFFQAEKRAERQLMRFVKKQRMPDNDAARGIHHIRISLCRILVIKLDNVRHKSPVRGEYHRRVPFVWAKYKYELGWIEIVVLRNEIHEVLFRESHGNNVPRAIGRVVRSPPE